jgi:hypothetical protein
MDFLLTLFGAVVGGTISLATTYEMQRRQDRKLKKATATALIFRIMEAGNGIASLLKYLREALKEERGQAIPKDRYWEKVQQLGGFPSDPLKYDVRELAILSSSEHNELVMGIIELINARNIAVSIMRQYNQLRESLDNDLAGIAQFEGEPDRMRARAEFNPCEHPEFMGKIHKANGLLIQLLDLLERSYTNAQNTAREVGRALPRYFPTNVSLKKVEFPDID